MNEKICLLCKKAKIKDWESACETCWNPLTPKQRKYVVVLNQIREAVRSCGIDLCDLERMW